MKKQVILLLMLGLVVTFADPDSEQKVSTDSNTFSESTDEAIKQVDQALLDKSDSEQKNEDAHTNDESVIEDKFKDGDANLQIFIEETFEDSPNQLLPEIVSDVNFGNEDIAVNNYDTNSLLERNPDEIMDTAAGFVPIPIIRWRQKPRRGVATMATRRQFKRHPRPYTGWRYFHPHYYYPYYRPSSHKYFY